jgi:hypothetical protein
MTRDELTAVVRGLLEKTRQNEVEWTQRAETDFWATLYPDHIVLRLPKSTIMIRREEIGQTGLTFLISNEEGRTVVQYRAKDTTDPLYPMLREMLDLALGRIRKVDETIHDVQDFLKKKPG